VYSKTVAYLEKFDNQHEFERMGTDILNALGYKDVVPVAPRGGRDGGRDIIFTTSDGGRGLACATLRKDIDVKFKEDFSQRKAGEYDEYILFCTAHLTANQKVKYIRFCAETLQAGLVPYDIEALRSLLDTILKKIKDAYLYVSDEEKQQRDIAQSIISFLEDRRVLYNPTELELPRNCIFSVMEIRRFLTEKIGQLDQSDELANNLRIMRAACRKFLDSAQRLESDRGLPLTHRSYSAWVFYSALGEMRGSFGMCLEQMVSTYKLDIEENLAILLLPHYEDNL